MIQEPGPQEPGPQEPGPQEPGPQEPGPQEPGHQIPLLIGRFAATLATIRDLLDVALPSLGELDDRGLGFDHYYGRLQSLPIHVQDALRRIFDDARAEEDSLITEGSSLASLGPDERPATKAVIQSFEAIAREFGPGEVTSTIGAHLALVAIRAGRRPPRSVLLLRSALTMAVSAFEVLIGGLVEQFYRLRPQALQGLDRQFSLAELVKLGTLDNLIDSAISRVVETVLHGNIEDWANWFKKALKLDFEALAPDWLPTRELFERRNVIVHNAGRVSRLYLERVPTSDPTSLGTELPLDRQYLEIGLERLLALGVLIGHFEWTKLRPAEGKSAAATVGLIFEDIEDFGQWQAMEQIASALKAVDTGEAMWPLHFQIYQWLSVKNLRGLGEVERAIRDWDISILKPVYELIRACLLNDVDRGLEVLPALLKSGEASLAIIDRAQVYAPLRRDPRYIDAARRYWQDRQSATED